MQTLSNDLKYNQLLISVTNYKRMIVYGQQKELENMKAAISLISLIF